MKGAYSGSARKGVVEGTHGGTTGAKIAKHTHTGIAGDSAIEGARILLLPIIDFVNRVSQLRVTANRERTLKEIHICLISLSTLHFVVGIVHVER